MHLLAMLFAVSSMVVTLVSADGTGGLVASVTAVPFSSRSLSTRSSTISPSLTADATSSETVTQELPFSTTGSVSVGTATITESATPTPTQIPPVPIEPLVDPRAVAAVLGAAAAVSAIAAVAFVVPLSPAWTAAEAVAFAWSPCTNESVRLSFTLATPVGLWIPLHSGASADGEEAASLLSVGHNLEGLFVLLGCVVLAQLVVLGLFYVARRRYALPPARDLGTCVSLLRFPGLSWLVAAYWLPGLTFLASRAVIFTPGNTQREAADTAEGLLAAILIIVPVLLIARGAAAAAATEPVAFVPFVHAFKTSPRGVSSALPRGYWTQDAPHFRRFAWVYAAYEPTSATVASVVFTVRPVLIGFALSIDVSAFDGDRDAHCGVILYTAAVAIAVSTYVCARLLRVPVLGYLQAAADAALCVCLAVQGRRTSLAVAGGPCIVLLLTFVSLSACAHLLVGLAERRWQSTEERRRREADPDWTSGRLTAPPFTTASEELQPLANPLATSALVHNAPRSEPWRRDPFIRIL
jgi:hypothetical protein